MKKIQLLNTNLYALVDDNLYDYLNKFTWYLHKSNNKYYASTSINKRTILMHQLVLPSPSGELTPDHINNDGLDNQLENLRLATHSQQHANIPKIKDKTSSQYKGVYWNRAKKFWVAQIKKDQKVKYLGHFNSEIDAAKAYNKAAFELFGVFASVNKFEPFQ